MKLSVVVPTYNEELAIAENAREMLRSIQGYTEDYELIFVNDGSTDKTLEKLQSLAETFSKIKIVSYVPNRGRGFALRSGFEAAKGDFTVVTESDLNWSSDIIVRLARVLESGSADIAVASPHMKGGRMENVPFARWFLSWAGNKVFSLVLPGHWTMVTGMTRGYKKNVLNTLKLKSYGKELHVEIIEKAIDAGFRITEIPAVLRWKKPKPGEVVRKSHFKLKSIWTHLAFALRLFAKYYLSYFLKLFVTFLLLWLLFRRVDFATLFREISGISPAYFLGGVLVLTFGWYLSTIKWQWLLNIFNFNLGIGRLFSYNLISIFYSIALPGGKLAGDAVRAYKIAGNYGSGSEAKKQLAIITFLDRGMVLLALVSFASASFIFGLPATSYLGNKKGLLALILFLLMISGCLLLFTGILDFLFKKFISLKLPKISSFFSAIFGVLSYVRGDKRSLFFVFLMSLISILVSAFSVYILSLGLKIGVDFWTVAFFNSLAVILISVPITIAGIGLREGGLVYLFFQAGVPLEKAVALSTLNLAMMLVLALAGGIIEFYYQFLKKTMREPMLEPLARYFRLKRIKPFLKPFTKCLDVGCGVNGKLVKEFSPNVEKIFGLDKKVNEFVERNMVVKKHNFNKEPMPFTDNFFDIITMLAVLEHVDRREYVLTEIYRILKPEGVLLLTVPTWTAKPILEFLAFKIGVINAEEVTDHKTYFWKNELSELVLRAGFRKDKIKMSYFELGVNLFLLAKK